MQVYIHTLGCPKNEVDSEWMASLRLRSGHSIVADPSRADAIVVNTCGFVETARSESIEWLRRYTKLKRDVSRKRHRRHDRGKNGGVISRSTGQGPAVVAAGCLAQRYGQRLLQEIPDLSGVLGSLRWSEIERCLREVTEGGRPCWTGPAREEPPVARLLRGPSVYLKIADGCSTRCAFCAIPQIKGPLRSRPRAEIVAEACELARRGATEIVLVAQDTTAYGLDRGEKDGLATLIEEIAENVPDLLWLRILYAHPEHLSPRLLQVMASIPMVVKYLDLPLQHAHPAVLARMARPVQDLLRVVSDIRAAVPSIALRSTFIVGYPGETDEEFDSLLSFLCEAKLDRVGAFVYSPEEGTLAATLDNQVEEGIKLQRYDLLMRVQQLVSLARNREFVGQELDVLVESDELPRERRKSLGERGGFGRSYRDAPEIDGLVYFGTGGLTTPVNRGSLLSVRITGAEEYDLVGEAVKPTLSRA